MLHTHWKYQDTQTVTQTLKIWKKCQESIISTMNLRRVHIYRLDTSENFHKLI